MYRVVERGWANPTAKMRKTSVNKSNPLFEVERFERELMKVQEGELVKISFRDDHGVNGTTSKWTRYLGFKEGKEHIQFLEIRG